MRFLWFVLLLQVGISQMFAARQRLLVRARRPLTPGKSMKESQNNQETRAGNDTFREKLTLCSLSAFPLVKYTGR